MASVANTDSAVDSAKVQLAPKAAPTSANEANLMLLHSVAVIARSV
jgi:hypothetical protein